MNKKGYTLIETLLVVTIIVSIMIPVYPVMQKQHQQYILEQETQKLASFLNRARQQAILQYRWTTVRFYVTTPNSYGIRDGIKVIERHYLPENISLNQNLSLDNEIIFGAFGSVRPHGGTIRLTNSNGEYREVIIHLFSGIIEVR